MTRTSVLTILAITALPNAAISQLAPAVVITELLAENRAGILDEDGDSSDWIEIQNQGAFAVDLDGWYLSDDAANLRKWRFPPVEILPGEFLIVFASGKDRAASDSELHAGFRLDRDGEFVGLVVSDGVELVHAYSPTYPAQRADISYGLTQQAARQSFISGGSTARLWVPADGRLGNLWTATDFDDSWWHTAETGIGFATGDVPPPPSRIENVARRGSATQSSLGWGGDPMRGIDGNTDGQWEAETTFHTNGPNSWWEVDLLDTYTIDSIVLWNRLDCCRERLVDFTVKILDSDRSPVFESGPHDGQSRETISFPNIDAAGQFVRIAMPGQYLHLAEVQVFGEVFDESLSFRRHIDSDVAGEMLTKNASAYLRIPFDVDDPDRLGTLTCRMKYDDGFVAYLNGTEVARRNAPAVPDWSSSATAERPIEDVLVFEDIDLSAAIALLVPGSNVLAFHALNLTRDDDDFLLFPELDGFHFAEQVEAYLLEPTPGDANESESLAGFVADTVFSKDRGFYDEPFDVEISTSTEGAEIRYTVDGSTPSPTNGSVYSGLIRISTTTVLRAVAFRDGLGPTNTDTQTYIFLDDVIDSPVLRTSVTEDPRYAPHMREGLTDIPSLCITAESDAFSSEVPISIELLHPDGKPGFQEDAGATYFGLRWAGSTYLKKSFRISFRSEYGDSKLRYPLFEGRGRGHGISPVEVFDQIELRSGHHDADLRGFSMSDRFTSDTMLDMGHLNPHGRFVHMYLNGVYWGQYNLRERFSADMFAEYFGGEEDDYEAIKANGGPWNWDATGVPYNGDGSTWATIRSLRSSFETIQTHLDVSQYVDFLLMFMVGNSELEFRCVGTKEPGIGFQFFMNDPDGFLRGPGASGGGRSGFDTNPAVRSQPGTLVGDGPGSIFSMLLAENHPDYRILLADRIQEIFFEDGPMSAAKNRERLLSLTGEVERSFLAESARWNYRTPSSWASARDSFLNGVLPSRTTTMIEHYRAAGLMLPVPAPAFIVDGRAQHGGEISPGAELSIGVSGLETFIETPVVDLATPRSVHVPQNGDIGNEWLLPSYEQGAHGESWRSGTGGVGYDTNVDYADAIGFDVHEEMTVNPGNASAFIRIPFTIADEPSLASLENLSLLIDFDDGFVAFLNGVRVAAQNAPDAGSLRWNSVSIGAHEARPGQPDVFDLSDFREHLQVGSNVLAIHGLNSSVDSSDFLIRAQLVERSLEIGPAEDDVYFTIDGSDPRLPGGELSPTASLYVDPVRLAESTLVSARVRTADGSWGPMSDTVYYTDMPLRVTEIMYNPAPPVEGSPFRRREFEFLELQNVSATTLNLRGVRIVDGSEFDFTTSAVTELGPGEVVVIVEDLRGFASRYDLARILVAGEYSGALDDRGERISIRGSLDEPILEFEYDDSWFPETDGIGSSLVIIDALSDPTTWGDADSWRPSQLDLGSPGIDESGLEPRGRQLPGDATQDGQIDISDAVTLLLQLFGRSPVPPPCDDGAPGGPGSIAVLDANADEEVNLSDAIWLLAYLFEDGAPPGRGTNCVRLEACPDACRF